MTDMLQIKRIQDCQEWLETSADDYNASQSISWLIDQLGQLCKAMAFVNNQMAVSRKILNERKVEAYHSLLASSVANAEYFAPSLAKDYISAKCSEEQFNYDLAERCSRTIVHTLEVLRTAVSALKEEAKINSYGG